MIGINENAPAFIIIDVKEHIIEFRNSIAVLPLNKDLNEHEIVDFIFEYICSVDEAKSNMLEFTSDIRESLESHYPERDIVQYNCALLRLSKKIVQRLKELNAYQDGILWYNFKSFCNNDVVLYRVTKEDFVN
jgi:hypothetical protein